MINLNILQIFILLLIYDGVKSINFERNRNELEINLHQGKIKGFYDFSNNQRTFLGIPYASVQERFQSPGDPPVLNSTFIADNGSIECIQYQASMKKVVGVENCLTLNVFTPIFQEKTSLSVMVFIFGGGFYSGSNTETIYNPKFLVHKNVIVVTINYRVGAFGFLCLGLREASGNMGLKDQVAALKWIQKNIAYFGGNPQSVTLFGQSSGAMSANYLTLLPSTKVLFHRAIFESGTILTPHAFIYTPIESASEVALRLGYNTTDSKELLEIFKNEEADNIAKATYVDPKNNALGHFIFRPCRETEDNSDRPLITMDPNDLLKKTDLHMPLIIGINNKEGITWAQRYTPITFKKVMKYLPNVVPDNLLFENETNKTAFINDIINIYFKNETAQDGLIDFFTDSLMRYPLTAVSDTLIQNPNNTLYNYYFTYDSTRNFRKLESSLRQVPGAAHGDELFYLFDPEVAKFLPSNPKDRIMITRMVNLWTTFAKTGKPQTGCHKWQPSKKKLDFLELGDTLKMITRLPHDDRIQFWREAYAKYGRN